MKNTAEEAVAGVDFSDVETKSKDAAKAEPKKAKTAKSEKKNGNGKGKTEKAEPKAEKKAAKAEKTEKVAKDDNPAPPEIKKWPYKQGSIALYVFAQMLKGVDKEEIEQAVVKGGYRWELILAQMRRANHKNHSWRLSEEGKKYKLYDVKYTGKHSKAKKQAAEKE